jgi:hypothetical protein
MLLILIYWVKTEYTIMKNTEAVVVASKGTGPKVNAEKTKYMLCLVNEMQNKNRNIKISNESLEIVAKFR